MLKQITEEEFDILQNNNITIYKDSNNNNIVDLQDYSKFFDISSEDRKILEKNNLINKYKDLEKKAKDIRLWFLTVELLEESIFKELKLKKIEDESFLIKKEFELIINELIQKYWQEILLEIL